MKAPVPIWPATVGRAQADLTSTSALRCAWAVSDIAITAAIAHRLIVIPASLSLILGTLDYNT